MKKMTLADLRKFRNEQKQIFEPRAPAGRDVHVVVGMATCGIAAGAKETFTAILEAVASLGIPNVRVRQTGCMGLCHSEPTVEVSVPAMPTVIYGKVDADLAQRIVAQHIRDKRLVENAIYDRPSTDIIAS